MRDTVRERERDREGEGDPTQEVPLDEPQQPGRGEGLLPPLKWPIHIRMMEEERGGRQGLRKVQWPAPVDFASAWVLEYAHRVDIAPTE